uniref:Uncharacterized protein n=1 Tax=Anguilla anguilla TaxID=7936 RepID=A0A0E9SBW6_ANGAN
MAQSPRRKDCHPNAEGRIAPLKSARHLAGLAAVRSLRRCAAENNEPGSFVCR